MKKFNYNTDIRPTAVNLYEKAWDIGYSPVLIVTVSDFGHDNVFLNFQSAMFEYSFDADTYAISHADTLEVPYYIITDNNTYYGNGMEKYFN